MVLLKIFTLWSALFYFSLAQNVVDKLQEQFVRDVLVLSAYKDRFDNYLYTRCADDNQCAKNTIQTLQQWDTVQNDTQLLTLLERKLALSAIDQNYFEKLKTKLNTQELHLEGSQFLSVVDLESQKLILLLWDDLSKEFHFIGQDYISSGNMEREIEIQLGEDHYLKTPAGVFKAHKGWRSDGKAHKDDDKILGYGKKDRFIFYFGEHLTIRYGVFDTQKNKIYDPAKWQIIKDRLKFAMHSHESRQSMGRPNSHGCIRMDDELNRFLDNNFVLHKPNINQNQWSHKYASPPNEPQNIDLAGQYLIVFDSIK
jgi:lipoprotein-anchoring transpeptidase ErfK/SrfK